MQLINEDMMMVMMMMMQARSSYEHLSVCMSVKRVHCDETNDFLIPYESEIHLVF